MGDRANVVLVEKRKRTVTGIFLYTHWSGTELPAILQDALNRGQSRWTDPSYLARIIFNEMTKGDEMSLTGYGISTCLTDNEHPLIIINLDDNTIGLSNEEYGSETSSNIPADLMKRRKGKLTFEEYLKLDFSDEDNSPSFWDVLTKACKYTE